MMLLTSNKAVFQIKKDIRIYDYPNNNIFLTHDTAPKNKTKILTLYSLFVMLDFVALFILKPLLISALILVFLSIVAFLFYSMMRSSHVTYQELLKLGIYASTTPLIIVYFLPLLHVKLLVFPGTFIIFILFYLAAFYEVYIYKETK
jgi:hypothetical protein